MFVIAIAMLVGGYGLLYYGVSMWQNNGPSSDSPTTGGSTPNQGGLPLAVVFGFKSDIPGGKSSGSPIKGSYPPFNFTSNATTPTTTGASTPTNTPGTSGGVISA